MKTLVTLATLVLTTSLHAYVITDYYVHVAANGSVLGAIGMYNSSTYCISYPGGFTFRSGKGTDIFVGQMPPGISTQAYLTAFDGTLAVYRDSHSDKTWTYALDSGGFTSLGSFTGEINSIVLWPSELVVVYELDTKTTLPYLFQAYDRKWKKLKWQITSPVGYYHWLDSKVLLFDVSNRVEFAKRGKVFASMAVPRYSERAYGTDGTVAHWFEGTGTTNDPLTCLNKKGMVVASNVTFAEAGLVWHAHPIINKGYLYLYNETAPGVTTVYAYKLGKTVTHAATVPITDFEEMGMDGTAVYMISCNSAQYKVIVYDRTLAKVAWESTAAEGPITRLGKGTFCRQHLQASSLVITVFGKKGTIATHTFNK